MDIGFPGNKNIRVGLDMAHILFQQDRPGHHRLKIPPANLTIAKRAETDFRAPHLGQIAVMRDTGSGCTP